MIRRFAFTLWNILVSVRLTIVLLIVISAVCVIGTIVPQNLTPQEYLRIYSESTYRIVRSAGFIDMYGAWWFVLLLGLFTLNLIACTINHIPRLLKSIAQREPFPDAEYLKRRMCFTSFTLEQAGHELQQRYAESARTALKRPRMQRAPDRACFFFEKGRYTRYAFYLTHIGIVVILAGALLGALGFEGYLRLHEGETSGSALLKKTREPHDLGFEVRCNFFEVEFYDSVGMPKSYRSSLTVIEHGEEVLTKVIRVNDPLVYRGIFFYQSSYGTVTGKGTLKLQVGDATTGSSATYQTSPGRSFEIAGTEAAVAVEAFVPDFAMDATGRVFSRSEQLNNPAVQLRVDPGDAEPYYSWVFGKFPDFHGKEGRRFEFSLLEYEPLYYTGLQVARDPGVWVVWVGCALLCAGIYMAFFMSHKRIWLQFAETDGQVEVLLAGASSRNKADFRASFDDLAKQLTAIGNTPC
jgi:cytochrome c biogenesis protein